MPETKLSKVIQVFIIQQLAMYEKPAFVRDALKQNFDVEISLQAVLNYQPTSPKFNEKWRDLFDSTRKSFTEKVGEIPIAHKAYRLRKLQDIFDKQESARVQNPVEMRATLEHAAKESGGMFTNQRVLTGKDGGAIAVDWNNKTNLIEAEARRLSKLNGTTVDEEKRILIKLLAQDDCIQINQPQ